MTPTPLDEFKRHVGYRVKADQDTFIGDGTRVLHNLQYENVFDVQVYFGTELQSGGYTVASEPGTLTFDAPVPDSTVVTIDYKFAPISDTEALAWIDAYGLEKAVIEALRFLLGNQSRLMNYKEADTEVDYGQVFKQVKALLDYYEGLLNKDESGQNSGVTISRRRDPRGEPGNCREIDVSRLYG